MANSKLIGNDYEREFSKKLSNWVSYHKNDDIFWRDYSSGSRFTKRKQEEKDTNYKGDIICQIPEFKKWTDFLYIDTKSYKKFNPLFINLNNIGSNLIFQQWLKTNQDCPKYQLPMMPCKIRDRVTPEFIIFHRSTYFEERTRCIYYHFPYDEHCCYLVLQDEFFKNEDPEEFYKRNIIYWKNKKNLI